MWATCVAVLGERHLGGESSHVGKRLGIAGPGTAACVRGGRIRREEAVVPASNGIIDTTSESKVLLRLDLLQVTKWAKAVLSWDILYASALYP